ncbi:hypothetical protein N6L24_00035 [Cognatishimia sp. SS12]|uniref:hypothetical protein n=1 Tax=Cognatishimia sp. SS12 TaxID=2979465 RepID=UPI00232F248E|nr:hypothetical protein [Cognatishimia sp. SS12]MDC0736654.1 hypothetical protein [Cognatishimia sp. SS12]
MTFPEWTKPSIYGALVGAIAISIIGFTWGGWTTNSNAQTMAKDFATDEVTLAMVPLCLGNSAADPERTEKLAVLQGLTGFGRLNAMMDTGWAIRPGSEASDRRLAGACLAGLELDAS